MRVRPTLQDPIVLLDVFHHLEDVSLLREIVPYLFPSPDSDFRYRRNQIDLLTVRPPLEGVHHRFVLVWFGEGVVGGGGEGRRHGAERKEEAATAKGKESEGSRRCCNLIQASC